jgi:hypothetical protein
MTAQDTIYVQLASYACIFPNRGAALNHLFCVLGNGYQWEDGQLVHVERYPIPGETPSQKIARVFDERRHERAATERRRQEAREQPADTVWVTGIMDKLKAAAAKRQAERQALLQADPEAYSAKMAAEEKERQAADERFKFQMKQFEDLDKWDYCVPDDIDQRMEDTTFNDWYPLYAKSAKLVNFPSNIKTDWLDALIETAKLILEQPNRITEHTTDAVALENQRLARAALNRAMFIRRGRA